MDCIDDGAKGPETPFEEPQKPTAPAPEKPQSSSGNRTLIIGGCLVLGTFLGLCIIMVLLVGGLIIGGSALIGSSLPSIESISSVATPHSFTEEHVSGSLFASDKIAVVDVLGMISSADSSMYQIANSAIICEQLKAAADDPSVKAVLVNLDTPGGEVTASDEIYHQVMELRETYNKPVVAMMNSLAASGGYYVAVGCDRIVANKLTLTGSIGVIIEGYNYAELFNKIGLKSEVYKSGKMKDMLDGSRPRTEEERQLVQRLVDSTYDEFVSVVSQGRKIPVERIKGTELGDGRVFDGKQALANKLVDKLGYFEDAIDEAADMAGTDNYKVIRYAEAFSLARIFESMSSKDARALSVHIEGLSALPPLRKGCLYFLPGQL